MRLLALLLLLPSLALGQGLTKYAPGAKSASKPLITPDANTTAHIWFPSGAGLVDTKANAWTKSGTVGVASTALFKTPRYLAGPFADANYYASAATSPLNFAGDFTMCAVVVPDNFTGAKGIVGACTVSTGGWSVSLEATTGKLKLYSCRTTAPGYVELKTTATLTAAAVNVICVGRSGTTQYAKVNLNAEQSNTATPTANPGVAYPIGRDPSAGVAFTGVLVELYATSTAWNASAVTALQTAVLAQKK